MHSSKKTRVSLAVLLAIVSLSLFSGAQKPESESAGLDSVLKKMDSAAASFRTTQADFAWERYEKVINETDDAQQGTVYYRRAGKDVEMKAEVKKPDEKFVLFRDGKVQVYLPKAEQVTVYSAGNNRAEVESYLVIGFGGSGQDLVKTFDVTFQGSESIDGVATAKLQLVPKTEKVRNTFSRILLWIDLERGVSVQQQFFEPQGDYRMAKYSRIRLNEKISEDTFKLKTTAKTQFVSPRG